MKENEQERILKEAKETKLRWIESIIHHANTLKRYINEDEIVSLGDLRLIEDKLDDAVFIVENCD